MSSLVDAQSNGAKADVVPVIMAGGSGTRLWPLSRASYPKQFLPLVGDMSLFQAALLRARRVSCCKPIVITNEDQRFLAAEQSRVVGVEVTIILEPEAKNTAPAIALAAHYARSMYCDAELLVLAADHYIADDQAFIAAVDKAQVLARDNYLVTFGVVPTAAETGYGYIRKGDSIAGGFHVNRFVEKPSKALAEEYVSSGCYLWNSGMFLMAASRYLQELARFDQQTANACAGAMSEIKHDLDFIRVNAAAFSAASNQSIDYAVMERTESAVVVPLSAGWSDLGSFSALKAHGQVCNRSRVVSVGSENNYVYSSEKLVALVGVEGLAVIDTDDALMVVNLEKDHLIKQAHAEVKRDYPELTQAHRKVHRPWGYYDSLDEGERFKVKRISVRPGAKLSVQKHRYRAEHWVVVKGCAQVTLADQSFIVRENESTYIPIGEVHALENPGDEPLELIEVQTGSYLGEDDIVRLEDRYGRLEARAVVE